MPFTDDAIKKADVYIAGRVDVAPTDFTEAGDGTFFDYMLPWWKELYELYLETKDPKHLAAAHKGARRYAQFVWFYPSIPGGNITVNPRGKAPKRGNAKMDGLLAVPKETVPAWRVSDQGLICEGNGTAQRLGILIATHAPYFLRIANDTDDDFLRDIARSAVIGRYANFPGYHLNTRFTTALEKPDFPLHDYKTLKETTSIHYNHILPQANLVIDYLVARTYDLSNGAIDFPKEFIEGYAYLQSQLYGAQAGTFYDENEVWPWLPPGLVTVDNVQVNYLAARGADRLCVAFMNASARPQTQVKFRLAPSRFAKPLTGARTARIWVDNKLQTQPIQIIDGEGSIFLSAKGITAICIGDVEPKPQFQHQLGPTSRVRLTNTGSEEVAGCKVEATTLALGHKLKKFYLFLRTKDGIPDIGSVSLSVELDGRSQRLVDEDYPFEFSIPIDEGARSIRYKVEVQ